MEVGKGGRQSPRCLPAGTILYLTAMCMYYKTPGLVVPCFPGILSHSPSIVLYPPESPHSPDSSYTSNLCLILIFELTNQPDCTVSLWPPGGSRGSANLVPVVTDYKAKECSLPYTLESWLVHP